MRKCQEYPYNFVERLVGDHPDVGFLIVTKCQQRLDSRTENLRKLGVLPDSRRAYPLDDDRAARHLLLPTVQAWRLVIIHLQGTVLSHLEDVFPGHTSPRNLTERPTPVSRSASPRPSARCSGEPCRNDLSRLPRGYHLRSPCDW